MTTKEQLHALVDRLGPDQATEALVLLCARFGSSASAETGSNLPAWVGMFRSGRGDLAERHEEILRDELDDEQGRGCLSPFHSCVRRAVAARPPYR
ncbi:MAG TPA: hypothetical protein VFM55_02070 [Micromonosporaceae bacterium]|nr:hypothetical protein [Micromonosporaceae bacterium]